MNHAVTISFGLLMGLTGSLHCAGMCGPIMWIMPFGKFNGLKRALAMAAYHAGRISVYAGLAVILYSFRSLFNPRIQQYFSVAVGSLLLIAGILSFIPSSKLHINLPWAEKVKKGLGMVAGKPGMGSMLLSGMLNGLLPCGLVYMALSASINAATPLQAVTFIYAFGLGTIPMLASISLLRTRVSFVRMQHIRRLVPITVFAFGLLFVLRGLNLGIPYLSPKVTVTKHEIRSCCHKPE